jgi:hypothetical protein
MPGCVESVQEIGKTIFESGDGRFVPRSEFGGQFVQVRAVPIDQCPELVPFHGRDGGR